MGQSAFIPVIAEKAGIQWPPMTLGLSTAHLCKGETLLTHLDHRDPIRRSLFWAEGIHHGVSGQMIAHCRA